MDENPMLQMGEDLRGPKTKRKPMEQRRAYFTFDERAAKEGYNLYYFAPAERAPGPYREQRHVQAIIDIASDGTLAGVELIDNMPPLTASSSPPSPAAPESSAPEPAQRS